MKIPGLNKSRIAFLTAGIVILAVLFKSFGIEKIIEHFRIMNWRFFLIIILYLFNNIIMTYVWKILINYPVKLKNLHKLYLARIAGDATSSINSLAALAGEPIKAMYIKNFVPLKIGLASVVLDRTIHSVSNTMLLFTGVIASFFLIKMSILVSVISILIPVFFISVIFIILKKQRDGFIEYLLSLLPQNIVNKYLSEDKQKKVKELDYEIAFILSSRENKKKFLISLFTRYAAVLASGTLEIFLILQFINIDVTLSHSILIYVSNMFVTNIIFFMPANLGVSEGIFTLALKMLGYDPAVGISLGMIYRLRKFAWSGIGMLILFHAGLMRKEKTDGGKDLHP
jgi:hypothetical protein